jgi:hypothetical protein
VADNTVLNPGASGDRVLTLDLGTVSGDANVKAQAVALVGVSGAEGSYSHGLVAGDATFGLDVDVTRLPSLPAGGNTIGNVGIASALPAGDNNIGNVDVVTLPALPAGTNNIGDVDVLTLPALAAGSATIGSIASITTGVVPGVGATDLGKAEDAAHTSGNVGVMALGVRQDTAASLAGTDGDYVPFIVDSTGRLHVNVGNTLTVNAHAVTNAGTFAVQVDGAALTALQLIDNLVLLEDAAHSTGDPGVMALGVRRDANTTLVGTDGDYAPFQVDANGGLKVSIIAGAGSGGTASTDDGAFTAGSGSGTPIMGIVTTDAVDSGDVGVVGMTLTRSLYTSIRTPLGDSAMDDTNDALRVNIVAGGGTGGTAMTDDAAFTPGSTSVTPIGAMLDNTSPDSVDEGDVGVLRMSANRNLFVALRDAAGNERGLNIDANGAIAITDGAGTITVDVGTALPAGTNNIGDVDVLSVIPGTGAADLGKAEDAVHASGDTGVMLLGVRRDTPASGAGADGDYATFNLSSAGRLYVSATVDTALPAGSATIGNIGTIATSVTPGTAAANLGKAVDAVAGAADTGIAMLAVRDDTLTTLTPADGDYTPFRVSSTGALWVNVVNGIQSIAEDTASAGGEDGLAILAVRRDSATAGVSADGDFAFLSTDSNGNLRVTAGGSVTEDAASAGGESLSLIGAVRQDTIASSLSTDGDYGYMKLNSVGRLYTSATVDAALPAGSALIGSIISIGTSVTPGTAAANLGKAEDVAHASGDTGVAMLAVRRDTAAVGSGTDGDYSTINVNAAGRVYTSATIDAALPAGTANIGDVDVLTMPGVFAEDAAHTTGDSGHLILAVRRDANTTLVGTDGDYAPFQVDANGSLKVAITAGAGSGGTSATDDAAFTPASGSGTPIMGFADETGPDSVDEGDVGVVRMTLTRALHVNLRSAAGAELSLPTQYAEDAASAGGELLTLAGYVRQDSITGNTGADGDYTYGKTDSAGRIYVNASGVAVPITDNAGSLTVDNAGTFVVQVDGAALTALQLIDNACIADDAAFTPATTGVHMAGFFADETASDSVDEGDGGAARMTLDRKQIVTEYVHAAAGGGSSYASISAAAVLTAEIKGSPGKVFSIQVFNLNAAARYVRLYNQTGAPGTGDTANVVWRGIIPGNTAGAGFVVQFPKGKQFATGIGIRASAAVADNDATALAANELFFNVDYA